MARVTDILFAKYTAPALRISPWTSRKTTFQGTPSGWAGRTIDLMKWTGSGYFVSTASIQPTGAYSADGITFTYNPSYTAAWNPPPSGISGLALKGTELWGLPKNLSIAGTQAFRRSVDNGVTWTTESATGLISAGWTASTGVNIFCMAWSGSKMLVGGGVANTTTTGSNGQVATSPTGLSADPWTVTTIGGTWGTTTVNVALWDSVNNQFIIFGPKKCATSPDGVTWTDRSAAFALAMPGLAVYAADINPSTGRIVAIGDDRGIAYSNNGGVTWTAIVIPGWSSGLAILDIVYANGQWVAVGQLGNYATSPDGITWTLNLSLRNGNWGQQYISNIEWDGTQYLIGGPNGSLATSPDAVTWTFNTALLPSWQTSSAYSVLVESSTGTVLAVGDAGKLNYSTDNGATWIYNVNQIVAAGAYRMYSITQIVSGQVMTVGESARAAISTNGGGVWSLVSGLQTAVGLVDMYSVASNGTTTVAVGATGKLAYTTDNGTTWTSVTTGLSSAIRKVIWSGAPLNKWVAVGDDGKCITSSDGITWTLGGTVVNAFTSMYSVAYDGASTLVAVGADAKAAYSTDGGTTWTTTASFGTAFDSTAVADAYSIKWNPADSLFFVIGQNGKSASSPDGITWTNQSSPTISAANFGATVGTFTTMRDFHFTGLTYIAVGDNGFPGGSCATSP